MSETLPSPATAELLADLAERVSRLEGWRPPQCDERVSSGCRELDALLPDAGLRRGTLVEWLAARPGSGAGTLALIAAREASRAGGAVVVVDRHRSFYPPAAIRWGLELEKLLLALPRSAAEEQWALDQVLRSQGVAAVLAWPERLDDREFRRLQLAAQGSGTLGLLIRPPQARAEPSWAALRLLVEPVENVQPSQSTGTASGTRRGIRSPLPQIPRRAGSVSARSDPGSTARPLRLEVLRAHGPAAGKSIHVILDEQGGTFHAETSSVHLAASVAPRTARRRSTGA